jgi:hypothetical protein
MTRRRRTRLTIAGWTLASCLAAAAASSSQFTSFTDHSRAILEGNWQSCREADGQYSERVYDANLPGIGPFELHMGPYHDFALFRGVQNDHREHNTAENLFRPYQVEIINNGARQEWDTGGLHFDVRLAGGSRSDCESWFVTLTRSAQTTSTSY